MAAYVVAQIDITDPALFEEYRRQVPPTLAPYGGKFMVRGGQRETLEGDWQPKRVVVIEFPDRASARAWWSSPEYAGARSLRQRAARTELILIEGV